MIYYIIAQDKDTYDEYVVSSHATAYEATQALDSVRKANEGTNMVYRVDIAKTVDEKRREQAAHAEAVDARRAFSINLAKTLAGQRLWPDMPPVKFAPSRRSNDYSEMLISQAGGDGDAIEQELLARGAITASSEGEFGRYGRTADFTLAELFSRDAMVNGHSLIGMTCTECGSLATDISKHLDWHNKLLP